MYEIIIKREIAPSVWRYSIIAPELALKRKPGNFVIVRPCAQSERIPLTIVDSDANSGSIDLIFQVVGATTRQLSQLNEKECLHDIAGPLGHATPIEYYGRVAVVGGGVGIAPLLPIAKALKHAGNHLTSVLGARSKNQLILEAELSQLSDHIVVATDDGTRGTPGRVTDVLLLLLEQQKLDFVLSVGPVIMMKAVSQLTRPFGVKTMVSLNPLMIDGTGMCGVCRCKVEGKTKFACVDGPEFDGHQVDYDLLMRRLNMYKEEERLKLESGS